MNIQGLQPQTVKSSVPFLSDILHTHNYTFIALTETWLGNHLEAELNIDGYKILRKDRDRLKSKYGRLSGGVAIYIKEDLVSNFATILEFSNGVNETLMLYSQKEKTLLSVYYTDSQIVQIINLTLKNFLKCSMLLNQRLSQ